MYLPRTSSAFRLSSLALGAAISLLGATAALADARSDYQRDRAACMAGQTSQDRATCLKEAGAALQEARRGRLETRDSQYEQNRLSRCDRQPAQDRPDCIRRMNGEGTVSGSVDGGGILRELVTPVTGPGSN